MASSGRSFIEQKIIIEVGPDLIDYEIGEHGLKEISRTTVRPKDLVIHPIPEHRR